MSWFLYIITIQAAGCGLLGEAEFISSEAKPEDNMKASLLCNSSHTVCPPLFFLQLCSATRYIFAVWNLWGFYIIWKQHGISWKFSLINSGLLHYACTGFYGVQWEAWNIWGLVWQGRWQRTHEYDTGWALRSFIQNNWNFVCSVTLWASNAGASP